MYTQCPECLTVYALDVVELSRSHGNVRCGHCTMVFDALPSLVETLPPDPVTGLAARPPSAEPPLMTQVVSRPIAEAFDETAGEAGVMEEWSHGIKRIECRIQQGHDTIPAGHRRHSG